MRLRFYSWTLSAILGGRYGSMKDWLFQLVTRGSGDDEPFQFSQERNTKIAYGNLIVVAMSYAAYYLYMGFPWLMVICVTAAFSGLFGFYLIRRNHATVSKLLVIGSALVATAIPDFYLGSGYGVYFFYFPIVLGTFVIFDASSVRISLATFAVALTLSTLSHFFGPLVQKSDTVILQNYQSILHQFNFVLSLFSSFTLFATANLIFWAAHKRSEKTKVQAMSNSRLLVLGDMAGGVAHEINNPLAIIQMRVEVLSRKLSSAKPPSSEEVIAQLVFIEKASFRIQRIVRSMNIFSKKSGDGPMRSTSLKKLFDETSDLCLEAMTKKLIKVQFTEVPDLQLVCYDTQLSQVILHIFNNAADAIENLEEKWIRVSFDVNDERLIIRFMDSGHGIHESIRQKIFDPFFTTKTVGKGTGLGLSISDSIMKTHGGEIRYQVVDNHTCFDLVFPIGSVASNVQARGVA